MMSCYRKKRIAACTVHLARFTSLPTTVGELPIAPAIRDIRKAGIDIVRATLGFRKKAGRATKAVSISCALARSGRAVKAA